MPKRKGPTDSDRSSRMTEMHVAEVAYEEARVLAGHASIY